MRACVGCNTTAFATEHSLPSPRAPPDRRLIRTPQLLQLLLALQQLLAHMHDHLDARQVDTQVVHQALDEADVLDIGVAEAADIAGAASRRDEPASLVHAQALLVHPAQLRR